MRRRRRPGQQKAKGEEYTTSHAQASFRQIRDPDGLVRCGEEERAKSSVYPPSRNVTLHGIRECVHDGRPRRDCASAWCWRGETCVRKSPNCARCGWRSCARAMAPLGISQKAPVAPCPWCGRLAKRIERSGHVKEYRSRAGVELRNRPGNCYGSGCRERYAGRRSLTRAAWEMARA